MPLARFAGFGDAGAMNVSPPRAAAGDRASWKAVAIPSEHGGWGLTLEPVLLGLLVAPSIAGLALGLAALLAFLVRTPLKLALVDVRRERWLARSALASKVAASELSLIAGLVVLVVVRSGWAWTVPVLVAAPLVCVQLWFDVRSRGRRLLPELCGAVGMAGTVATIVIAAGKGRPLAAAAWLVLAARSVGAIPFVRVQIVRLRRGAGSSRASDIAQVVAILIAAAGAVVAHRLLLGAMGIVALAGLQVVWVRKAPTVAKVLGMRQMALGFGLVALAATGVMMK